VTNRIVTEQERERGIDEFQRGLTLFSTYVLQLGLAGLQAGTDALKHKNRQEEGGGRRGQGPAAAGGLGRHRTDGSAGRPGALRSGAQEVVDPRIARLGVYEYRYRGGQLEWRLAGEGDDAWTPDRFSPEEYAEEKGWLP
jgi:hypothetical protein